VCVVGGGGGSDMVVVHVPRFAGKYGGVGSVGTAWLVPADLPSQPTSQTDHKRFASAVWVWIRNDPAFRSALRCRV
jgi:hypothetical protein